MFTATIIASSFIGMLAAVGLFSFFEKRGMLGAAKISAAIGLFAAAYCIAAGLFLLADWQDPFAVADPHEIAKASGTHGGRGGIVIFAIRFWPYVLIGFGGYFAYSYFIILRNLRSRVHA